MATIQTKQQPHVPIEAIEYPDSDGKPMADNDRQYFQMTLLRFGLQVYYRDNPQVYVGANLLIYYVEGNPRESVAPDVFLSLSVPAGERRTYLVWKEGKVPDLVVEIASETTHWRDLAQKKGLYEWLGVREYI